MKVAVIGSGGREHALCFALKKSKKVNKVYCIPGNAGTDKIAENVDIDLNNFQKIEIFIKKNKIEFVVIGPEKPLVDGITDYLEKKNIRVFGPNQIASKLEGSKIFTKKFVRNIKYLRLNLAFLKILKSQKNFLKNASFQLLSKQMD